MMRRTNTRKLAISGMLTGLVLLATFALRLPVQPAQGYIHLGDTFILFSALLVGPSAAFIGAVGSAMADLMAGYAVYVLPTLAIKGLCGWIAGTWARRDDPHAMTRCAMAFGTAELYMALGYALFEGLSFGLPAALGALPANLLQGGVSAVLACMLLPVARRIAPLLTRGGKPL